MSTALCGGGMPGEMCDIGITCTTPWDAARMHETACSVHGAAMHTTGASHTLPLACTPIHARNEHQQVACSKRECSAYEDSCLHCCTEY
jgi:hypothetical protein